MQASIRHPVANLNYNLPIGTADRGQGWSEIRRREKGAGEGRIFAHRSCVNRPRETVEAH